MIHSQKCLTMAATAVSHIVQDSQNFVHEVVQDFNLC